MKKLKPREWLLLFVPLALAALALVAQFGLPMRRGFYVESARAVELMPSEVAEGYDTKLEVVMNHAWPRPAWWNQQSGYARTRNPGDMLMTRDGKPVFGSALSVSGPHFDARRERYISNYWLTLARVPPKRSDLLLKSNLAVGMDLGLPAPKPISSVVSVTQTVRLANVRVQKPRVSHLTNMVPFKAFAIFRSTAAARAMGGYDVALEIVFKKTNELAFPEGQDLIDGAGEVTDERGRDVYMPGGANSLTDLSWSRTRRVKFTRADEFYTARFDWILPAGKNAPKSLRLKSYATIKGAWPVAFVSQFAVRPRPSTASELVVEVPIREIPFQPRK